jgi:hypothetical protein
VSSERLRSYSRDPQHIWAHPADSESLCLDYSFAGKIKAELVNSDQTCTFSFF